MPMLLYGNGTISGATSFPTAASFGSNLSVTGYANVTQGLTTASRGINSASVPAGGIIQVQSYDLTTYTTTTSGSFVDTGLTVNITPTSSTSKIYIIVSLGTAAQASSGTVLFNLVRNSTTIAQPSSGGQASSINMFPGATSGSWGVFRTFMDSPATTSTTTYKVQWRVDGGTGYLNRHSGNTEYNTYSEITVMEIAQ